MLRNIVKKGGTLQQIALGGGVGLGLCFALKTSAKFWMWLESSGDAVKQTSSVSDLPWEGA